MSKTLTDRYASALGVYDGRAYEQLVEKAKTEPMNSYEVSPAYEVSFCLFSLTIVTELLVEVDPANPGERKEACAGS
jgi:hypothetical protein